MGEVVRQLPLLLPGNNEDVMDVCFDPAGTCIVITKTAVYLVDVQHSTMEPSHVKLLAGGPNVSGFEDGIGPQRTSRRALAKFKDLSRIEKLKEGRYVVIDEGNHALRTLTLDNDNVASSVTVQSCMTCIVDTIDHDVEHRATLANITVGTDALYVVDWHSESVTKWFGFHFFHDPSADVPFSRELLLSLKHPINCFPMTVLFDAAAKALLVADVRHSCIWQMNTQTGGISCMLDCHAVHFGMPIFMCSVGPLLVVFNEPYQMCVISESRELFCIISTPEISGMKIFHVRSHIKPGCFLALTGSNHGIVHEIDLFLLMDKLGIERQPTAPSGFPSWRPMPATALQAFQLA